MQLTSWGRYPRITGNSRTFDNQEELQQELTQLDRTIVHAQGRSYGDSALAPEVLLSKRYNCILDFDPQTGLVHCESGVTLNELISTFLPRGWFLKVTPGTKLISVGGAIASDVHGKNHHVAGCFSQCVREFGLMLPDGKVVRCSKDNNRELFLATCGGMGLTGIIMDVKLELQPVSSAFIDQVTFKARNLSEIFDLFEENESYPYSVAWIDCLATGASQGRSLLMVGNHAPSGGLRYREKGKKSVPIEMPSCTLNQFSVKAFNLLYYNRVRQSRSEQQVTLDTFFYPLDALHDWNRIYGKRGFTQYQCVLPLESSYQGLTRILDRIAASGLGSFLAVLKLFGEQNDCLLSFPRRGYTLALDFKIEPKLFPLLDTLDRIVLEYGGRLYLTKDVRMKKHIFETGYPRLDAFRRLRERYGLAEKMQSLQSKRLEF